MTSTDVERHRYWHALPIGWEQLPYEEFCEKRRKLMARVVADGFRTLLDRGGGTVEPLDTMRLIADGESNVLEFKSTARWNLRTAAKDPKIEHVIVKTVAGFMNAEGGILLIGVADDGLIVGLDNDYRTLTKGDRDGFELFLTQLVGANISGPSPTLIRTSFEKVDGKDICRVSVAASAKPVFTKPATGGSAHTEFWVRLGNQTAQLHGAEMFDYRADHWG
jgi:predicted HTH transcriptional regulator